MDILGIVSAFAPDHVAHVPHSQLDSPNTDVQVQCGCSVRLTFLASEIAKLEPALKATIAFQVGTRSAVNADGKRFAQSNPSDTVTENLPQQGGE